MNETEMEHRLTEVEARAKSNTHRIDKLEKVTEEIHIMSNTMIQLVEEVKHTNETVASLDKKVDKMDSRVDEMESAPGKEWSDAKRTLFNTAVGAIITFLITGLIFAAVKAF
jgi:predicted nuclease with TOPRIM domain|nr:MAG TPA: hemolysin [Caudoviricetes sp.]